MKRTAESPLSRCQKSITRQDLSPKRSAQKQQHTVYNEDKLKVFIKFKPSRHEENGNEQVRYVNDQQIEVKTSIKNKMYRFDYVFNGMQNHMQVFDIGCKELIDNVFSETYEKSHGNNGLIFVYGNTGTGKTYSMGLLNLMSSESQGIVPNSLRYIFQLTSNCLKYEEKRCYENMDISISFCEVYMDEVYDLLDFETDAKLTIREDSKTKQPYLENQTTIAIDNAEQAFKIINIGLEKRRVAEQKMNRKSSRGHGLITINLCPNNGDKPGKVCFIDLAGCERLKDSQSKGTTLIQALHINSSLSSLETLLMNISDQNVRNYRASKLTRILQPYIQYGKIHLFVTSTHESINAIEFAKRCKGIKFMERQLRASTPIKRSNISNITEKANCNKQSREIEQLLAFRREAIDRQKRLVSCILNLTSMISKISQQLEATYRGQTIHNKFSFSDIINNVEIENKINSKIREYQSKQEKIIQFNLQKLQSNNLLKITADDVNRLLDNPHELVREVYNHAHDLINGIRAFGVYAEYKNNYKKEFFTSELKFNLLENKCKKNEESIYGLMRYMNTDDKRVAKRLKEMGIVVGVGKENIEHHQHTKHKKTAQRSTQKTKATKQQTVHDGASFSISQHQRSAIFIDEV